MPRTRPPTRKEEEALKCIGLRVGELRRKAGLTQNELADELGLSVHRVRAMETKVFNLTALALMRLARPLGVEAWQILQPPAE